MKIGVACHNGTNTSGDILSPTSSDLLMTSPAYADDAGGSSTADDTAPALPCYPRYYSMGYSGDDIFCICYKLCTADDYRSYYYPGVVAYRQKHAAHFATVFSMLGVAALLGICGKNLYNTVYRVGHCFHLTNIYQVYILHACVGLSSFR